MADLKSRCTYFRGQIILLLGFLPLCNVIYVFYVLLITDKWVIPELRSCWNQCRLKHHCFIWLYECLTTDSLHLINLDFVVGYYFAYWLDCLLLFLFVFSSIVVVSWCMHWSHTLQLFMHHKTWRALLSQINTNPTVQNKEPINLVCVLCWFNIAWLHVHRRTGREVGTM